MLSVQKFLNSQKIAYSYIGTCELVKNKFSEAFLAISTDKLYVIHFPKNVLTVYEIIHLYEITELYTPDLTHFTITYLRGPESFRRTRTISFMSRETEIFIQKLLLVYNTISQGFPPDYVFPIKILPKKRKNRLEPLLYKLLEDQGQQQSPIFYYIESYRAFCSYYETTPSKEYISMVRNQWVLHPGKLKISYSLISSIAEILNATEKRRINIQLRPIFSSLIHNAVFETIDLSDLRFKNNTEIISLINENRVLRSLKFRLASSAIKKLAKALKTSQSRISSWTFVDLGNIKEQNVRTFCKSLISYLQTSPDENGYSSGTESSSSESSETDEHEQSFSPLALDISFKGSPSSETVGFMLKHLSGYAIRSIHLENVSLTVPAIDEFFRTVPVGEISSLSFRGVSMTPDFVKTLTRFSDTLSVLKFSSVPMDKAHIKHIKKFRHLTTLKLENCGLNASLVDSLMSTSHFGALSTLDISQNAIESLRWLRKDDLSLECLKVGNCHLGRKGQKDIAKSGRTFRFISLTGNPISAKYLTAYSKLTKVLDVSNCELGAKGVKEFFDNWDPAHMLKSLSIARNFEDSPSDAISAINEFLKKMPASGGLVFLDIDGIVSGEYSPLRRIIRNITLGRKEVLVPIPLASLRTIDGKDDVRLTIFEKWESYLEAVDVDASLVIKPSVESNQESQNIKFDSVTSSRGKYMMFWKRSSRKKHKYPSITKAQPFISPDDEEKSFVDLLGEISSFSFSSEEFRKITNDSTTTTTVIDRSKSRDIPGNLRSLLLAPRGGKALLKALQKNKKNLKYFRDSKTGENIVHLVAKTRDSASLIFVISNVPASVLMELNSDDETVLHYIVKHKLYPKEELSDIIYHLIDFGFNINKASPSTGKTVLEVVVEGYREPTIENWDEWEKDISWRLYVLRALLLNRAIPDIVNEVTGCTPFHISCKNGFMFATQMFIDTGIDISIRDNKGETGLHKAASNGNLKLLALLIKNRIDIMVMNNQGQTAYDIVVDRGFLECKKFFEDDDYDIDDIMDTLLDSRVITRPKRSQGTSQLYFTQGISSLETTSGLSEEDNLETMSDTETMTKSTGEDEDWMAKKEIVPNDALISRAQRIFEKYYQSLIFERIEKEKLRREEETKRKFEEINKEFITMMRESKISARQNFGNVDDEDVDSISLQNVLENTEIRMWFVQYLEKVFAVENLRFFLEVESLKKIPKDMDYLYSLKAKQIYQTYIAETTDAPVIIDFKIKEDLDELMQSSNIVRSVYENAEKLALDSLQNDSFVKFTRSVYFKKMVLSIARDKLSLI